jgi:hypothetical protein
MPRKVLRPQRHTILIVCEGYAEEALVRHIRALYLHRATVIALSAQNARGKGGKHVVDHALRVRNRSSYDTYAVLLDTDQDWDDEQQKRADANGIRALKSVPCLEAWLLAVNGHAARENGSLNKREFERVYGTHAHDAAVYRNHFPKDVLDRARSRIDVLEQLLTLLRV